MCCRRVEGQMTAAGYTLALGWGLSIFNPLHERLKPFNVMRQQILDFCKVRCSALVNVAMCSILDLIEPVNSRAPLSYDVSAIEAGAGDWGRRVHGSMHRNQRTFQISRGADCRQRFLSV